MSIRSFSNSAFCRLVAVTLVFSLTLSSVAQSLQSVGVLVHGSLGLVQDPDEYSDGPGTVEPGPNPGRSETEDDIWDEDSMGLGAEIIADAEAAHGETVTTASQTAQPNMDLGTPGGSEDEDSGGIGGRGPFATPEPAYGPKPQSLSVPGGGPPLPWEETFPGGGSNSVSSLVNSNTGNRWMKLPILSFPIRGGLNLSFNLYHSSQAQSSTAIYRENFGLKWSSDFDARLTVSNANPPSSSSDRLVVRWGNGRNVPFTWNTSAQKYVPPAGVYDRITGGGYTHFPEWYIVTKHGIKYTFVSPKPGNPSYNRQGVLKKIEDPNGNAIEVVRETVGGVEAGRILFVKDGPSNAPNRRISFGYDTNGNCTTIRDNTPSTNRTWTLAYTSDRLTSIQYPPTTLGGSGPTRSFTYDASHNILSETDLRGKSWTVTYSSGKCSGFGEPAESYLGLPYFGYRFYYTATEGQMEDPHGRLERHLYTNGKISTIIDPALKTEAFSWDGVRRVQSYKDKLNSTWTTTYDTMGNPLRETSPLGYWNETTYNADNTPSSTFHEASNRKISYSYTHHRLSGIRREYAYGPLPMLATATVQSTGLVTQVELFPGTGPSRETLLTYQPLSGALETVKKSLTSPASQVTTTNTGWVTEVKDELGKDTDLTRDRWGRVTRVDHPAIGGVRDYSTISYDNEGNVTQVVDERGQTHSWTYNDRGLPLTSTNGRGDVETYTYTYTGFLKTVVNGRGYTRTYFPTVRDEVVQLNLPDGTRERWQFDGGGNATKYWPGSLSGGDLFQIGYEYDVEGRLKKVDYPTGTDTTFTYSAAGVDPSWESMTDSTGTTTWTYDYWGDLTSLVTPQGTTTYTYNTLGERTSMTDVGTGTTTTTYDEKGQVASITNPQSETTSWEYDAVGRTTKRTLGNATWEELAYDNRGRPTSITLKKPGPSTLRTTGYTYDAGSNILTHAVTGQPTTTYTYDAISQLLSESKTGYSASYTYDANGNRATRTLNGVTETYTNDNGDKLTGVTWSGGSRSYGYDAIGRRTSKTVGSVTTTYGYDYESRISTIHENGVLKDTYGYNGLDTRVSASGVWSGSKTFKRDGASVTSGLIGDGTSTFTPGISERRSGTSTYLHSGIKNADARTASGSAVTAERSYDAFGNLVSSSGAWDGAFGYAGGFGYQEDASGLKLLGHRYYDPEVGRFLTRDPIKDGRNWYAYCGNNPTGNVDPAGLSRITYLYRLLDANDNLLKYGITYYPGQPYTTKRRYYQPQMTSMNAEKLEVIAYFPNRKDARQAERDLVEWDPGPLNREPWAGRQKPDSEMLPQATPVTAIPGGGDSNLLGQLYDTFDPTPIGTAKSIADILISVVNPIVAGARRKRQRAFEYWVSEETNPERVN